MLPRRRPRCLSLPLLLSFSLPLSLFLSQTYSHSRPLPLTLTLTLSHTQTGVAVFRGGGHGAERGLLVPRVAIPPGAHTKCLTISSMTHLRTNFMWKH